MKCVQSNVCCSEDQDDAKGLAEVQYVLLLIEKNVNSNNCKSFSFDYSCGTVQCCCCMFVLGGVTSWNHPVEQHDIQEEKRGYMIHTQQGLKFINVNLVMNTSAITGLFA